MSSRVSYSNFKQILTLDIEIEWLLFVSVQVRDTLFFIFAMQRVPLFYFSVSVFLFYATNLLTSSTHLSIHLSTHLFTNLLTSSTHLFTNLLTSSTHLFTNLLTSSTHLFTNLLTSSTHLSTHLSIHHFVHLLSASLPLSFYVSHSFYLIHSFLHCFVGTFRKGMKVGHSRMKRTINLSSAQALFAQDRESITEAFPGDVIGTYLALIDITSMILFNSLLLSRIILPYCLHCDALILFHYSVHLQYLCLLFLSVLQLVPVTIS